MEFLKRLSEWNGLDWSILIVTLVLSLMIWTIILFIAHILLVRRNVKAVQDRYEELVKPYLFGDNNQTVKEQLDMKNINKKNW